MSYSVNFKSQAIKDLKKIPKKDVVKLLDKIKSLENGLKGDVKKLTNFTPEFRLRVGNWRVLFEVLKNEIIIYRVKHRKEVYSKR